MTQTPAPAPLPQSGVPSKLRQKQSPGLGKDFSSGSGPRTRTAPRWSTGQASRPPGGTLHSNPNDFPQRCCNTWACGKWPIRARAPAWPRRLAPCLHLPSRGCHVALCSYCKGLSALVGPVKLLLMRLPLSTHHTHVTWPRFLRCWLVCLCLAESSCLCTLCVAWGWKEYQSLDLAVTAGYYLLPIDQTPIWHCCWFCFLLSIQITPLISSQYRGSCPAGIPPCDM